MRLVKSWEEGAGAVLEQIIGRDARLRQEVEGEVREIIDGVRCHGDQALLEYGRRFDGVTWGPSGLRVQQEEIDQALRVVDGARLGSLMQARENILRYHERQRPEGFPRLEEGGVMLDQLIRPLARVGVYIPGGKAAYPSSVLMNVIPAKVAGVKQVVMCSAPSPAFSAGLSPYVLAAAHLVGVDAIYRVGGAQAIAAMAWGTESVPRVDKIVGPGNRYVVTAKRLVFGVVDIDLIAGPSEVLIVADESARPEFVAADLLAQAEHDEQALPLCISTSLQLADQVMVELERQLPALKRATIARRSLADQGYLIVVRDLEEAIGLSNAIAPEHLELAVAEPRAWLDRIEHAGAIFLGHYTPVPLGDYLAGPSHTLPTAGTARFFSPLGVYDFMKRSSVVAYSREALAAVRAEVMTLAEMEGLDGHAQALRIRDY